MTDRSNLQSLEPAVCAKRTRTTLPAFARSIPAEFERHYRNLANYYGAACNSVLSLLDRPSARQDLPTIFHITMHKAGSQWIRRLLTSCYPHDIVAPKFDSAQFLEDRIRAGKVYPAVYVTREQFQSRQKPENSAYFVVLRDPRDVAVSGYFSMKISHEEGGNLDEIRRPLLSLSKEEGFLRILRHWLTTEAAIFASWVESDEPWIRYEDLLVHEYEILAGVLLNRCRLGMHPMLLRGHLDGCRFERSARGRTRGEEDIASHYRKGIAGDWRNHFTPRIKAEFKERYGQLLIKGGYEKDDGW